MMPPLSVAQRLALGFASLVLMLVGVATLNGLEIRATGERMRQIVEVNSARSDLAHEALNHINQMAVQARSIALLTDLREIDNEVKALAATAARYAQTEAALNTHLDASPASTEERALVGELAVAAKATIPLLLNAAKQAQDGSNIGATTTLMTQARPQEAVWRSKVEQLVALERAANGTAYADAVSGQQRALGIAAAVVALAVLAGALLGWRITRSVKWPIDRAIRVAERIAEGDLSSHVEVGQRDEIGRLLAAVAAMQQRLRDLVGQIRQSSDSIHVASAEVSTGNADLSQRTERAASSLQQTASSMEELSSTVRHSASAAEQANQLARRASAVASRGGEVVTQMVATMSEIHDSSEKISEIIGVIDGIAFQTNILALNAGVEAARAGDQGRGFAVVAGEVRSLAQRSAVAAKEIKALIDASVGKVDAGSRLVKSAGDTMSEIVKSVEQVAAIVGEITSSASAQSSGIGQVSSAVTQLDQVTQQNAALVEEASAAAESLREQAQRLTDVVATFRLN
ncbi:MAG TPA: methyl-accepting chemotaxis protein [Rhizobacter sp.]|nr:methyl-accepting chemotaxis protein [Rhizobacter sp.]